MSVTREQLVAVARSFIGVRWTHQGRNPTMTGLDCGGLALESGRVLNLTTLEFLGYASFPTNGKFDELLAEETDFLWEREFPFNFTGDELRPADLVSFDYGNGEGTRHLAIVTRWDGRRYRIVDSLAEYGVSEHALAAPFVRSKTKLKAWGVRGIV